MGTAMTGFGAHEGHVVHPHHHEGQDAERRKPADWCSKRYLCATCSSVALPRGTWFNGPACPPPPVLNGKAAGR